MCLKKVRLMACLSFVSLWLHVFAFLHVSCFRGLFPREALMAVMERSGGMLKLVKLLILCLVVLGESTNLQIVLLSASLASGLVTWCLDAYCWQVGR